MKRIVFAGAMVLATSASAGDYKPFVMVDVNSEKDANSIANEYIGANATVGVKGPNKIEYSVKAGVSAKNADGSSDTISNNIEVKLKKSYDIAGVAMPYVSVRLGEKIKYTGKHFTHYAFDAGVKVPLVASLALDVGARYRDAFDAAENYQSVRYHAMFLYDVNPHNTVGLRYAQSTSDNYEEERKSWRVHYQHNY